MSTPRALAQDAASWYFSQLDPYASNESNIQTYLRTPLVALTVKTLQQQSEQPAGSIGVNPSSSSTVTTTKSLPASSVSSSSATSDNTTDSPGGGVEEHKEEINSDQEDNHQNHIPNGTSTNGNGDWRDYLKGYKEAEHDSNDLRQHLQEEYESLSRRTRARMEAFLAGCSLAVPGEVKPGDDDNNNNSTKRGQKSGSDIQAGAAGMVSLQDGLSGFSNVSNGVSNGNRTNHNNSNVRRAPSLTEKMSRSMIGDVTDPQAVPNSQIDQNDLIVRLELYVRTVQRVRNLKEECVVAMEPPKVIKIRARYITNAFVATTSYVRNIKTVLTRLLSCLTMEMLAVECLADEIMKVIRRVVLEYEHGTSFASLAFLSTPEVNADSLLTPLIVKYLKYLQADWERLVRECELERMLARALDPTMRKLFKTIEFQSIGHLLEVCHEYRYNLSNIELPPNVCAIAENIHTLCNSPEAIRQALRDLRREIITVNGHVLPPVTSRKELIQLLTQTLNSRTLTAKAQSAAPSTGPPSTKKRLSHRQRKDPEQRATSKDASNKSTPSTNGHKKKSPPDSSSSSKATNGNTTSNFENASDADVDESQRGTVYGNDATIFSSDYDSSSAFDDSATEASPGKGNNKTPGNSRRRRSKFHLSTIDVLTRRLLIAASRTGNGGDAYFFVKDLFGGEEVEVVPSKTYAYQDRIIRPGTIDILVRLASVTIKCHQSFDIYPKELVGECEPLIQFHTTTTESISLQEVRASDSTSEDEPIGGYTPDDRTGDDDKENPTPSTSVMVVREQETDRTGWRTISIRAAMYERVETWLTPS